MAQKYADLKIIEMIIQGKMRKQELIMGLESVDDEDLLELINKLNSETSKGLSDE